MSNPCSQYCLACDSIGTFSANPWTFHKLCASHASFFSENTTCKFCCSTITLMNHEPISCELCSSPNTRTLACNHSLCSECNSSETCVLCSLACSYCEKEAVKFVEKCGHLLCILCANKSLTECIACISNHCFYCTKKIKNIENPICRDCEEPCFVCNQRECLKENLKCKHKVCIDCYNNKKNECAICSEKICLKCGVADRCKKGDHLICYECKGFSCLKCNPNQYCSRCGSIKPRKLCMEGSHNLCKDCYYIKEGRYICKICEHICCVCNINISFRDVIQNNCGHNICENCSIPGNKQDCRLCPQIKEQYQCESCKGIFSNKNQKQELKNCSGCGTKICTICGKKARFLLIHKCLGLF